MTMPEQQQQHNGVWWCWDALVGLALLQALYTIGKEAYDIRMYAIHEFGRVIHEFDPYFNYRATEYLYANGWKQFSQWFDYKVWYPLGRPVGTTIYPGMQVTAVWIKKLLLDTRLSINDICVFMPVWFGVLATFSVAWLTFECTHGQTGCLLQSVPLLGPLVLGKKKVSFATQNKWTPHLCATFSAAIMSIVPAHLLRSVGGGYDNECIAMTAMCLSFASWVWSLKVSFKWAGILVGVCYFYMVAAWGGYVFVLNLIGVHAAFLVATGRYSQQLYSSYTGFYLVGTFLATLVPVVSWTPLKSVEQLGPLGVFLGIQLLEVSKYVSRHYKMNIWKARCVVFALAGAVAALVVLALIPTGYFGPISSRVRGLFVKHTKTGNPLVDSVAEHQPASPQAYFQYLDNVVYLAPIGLALTVLFFYDDASSFLVVYSAAAYYFSHRMVRLILLTAPIASTLGGIFLGRFVVYGITGVYELVSESVGLDAEKGKTYSKGEDATKPKKIAKKKGSNKKKDPEPSSNMKTVRTIWLLVRLLGSLYMIRESLPYASRFYQTCHAIAKQISHPTIINKAQLQNGQTVMVDDYREAYFWLKKNTPEDARIMAWWDYGYQITGIAERTTIADGNTWNHEHIALLGRTLTSSEKEAHRIARHLADYVLVWAGGGGDDLAKSPHLRRIANSVYRGLCQEPTCREFGFYQDRTPSKQMGESLLYKLVSHNIEPDVQVDRNRFKEVYKSKYGKVRIYKILSVSKESKKWVEENRKCDAPGSWFCPGHYPPALEKILKEKKDFAQLEDFNRGQGDEDYQKEYFDNINKKRDEPMASPRKTKKAKKLSPTEIDILNEDWEDSQITSMVYEMIAQDRAYELREIFGEQPELAHVRSEDGRGPMWWAHENGNEKIVRLLKSLDVSEARTDSKGLTPLDITALKK